METVLRKMADSLRRCGVVPGQERILAAVSGGADSLCLMLALRELGCGVRVLHVEHGIRGRESLEDARFVQQLCDAEKIPCTVEQIDAPELARRTGQTLEEAARSARYRLLEQTARREGIRVIAAAHHMGDQAETVLWNLIRGSGLSGLNGIRPSRSAGGDLLLIRPLLDCSREEIEAYLRSRGQTWRSDRTNLDPAYTRNAIRLEIMPRLEALNEGAAEHIARAAADLAETEEYLEAEVRRHCERIVRKDGRAGVQARSGSCKAARSSHGCRDGEPGERMASGTEAADIIIDRDALLGLPGVIRRRILLSALGEACGGRKDLTRRHVEALEDLAEGDNGRRISLPCRLTGVREEGLVRLTRSLPEPVTEEIPLGRDGEYHFPAGNGGSITVTVRHGVWEGGEVPKKKYTKLLAYDTIGPCIMLRTRRAGDWLTVTAEGGRRKLKDYLIDEKIPRDLRDSLPLIAQGSHVLWVVGGRISEGAKVRAGAHFAQITVSHMENTGGSYERDFESPDSGRRG